MLISLLCTTSYIYLTEVFIAISIKSVKCSVFDVLVVIPKWYIIRYRSNTTIKGRIVIGFFWGNEASND